jgi:uncharacterized protein (TIGR00369 family)
MANPNPVPNFAAPAKAVSSPSVQLDSTFVPSRMQVPPNCDLTLGMTCVDKSVPGRTTWRMTADERFANPAGILQGGFLTAFADSAMGAAAVTFVEERRVFCVNAELKISFLAAVPVGAELTCTAEPESGTERLVGRATSTYVFRKRD